MSSQTPDESGLREYFGFEPIGEAETDQKLQELKRRIDTFYASFTGDDVATTNN